MPLHAFHLICAYREINYFTDFSWFLLSARNKLASVLCIVIFLFDFRYFSSEGSASGTENDAHSEILSMMNPESDSGAFYTTGENSEDALRPLESPPEPKRVKLGSINNSDFLWRTSLKSHSSKLLGGEESSSLNVHQDSKVKESIKPRDSILKAEDCQTAVNKPKSVYESCTLSTNQDGVGLERSELAAVYKATSLKLSPPIVDTPRLPCFSTSLTDEEDQRQQFTFGLMPFSLGNNVSNTGDRRYSQLQKRVSLFKYAKAKNTKCQTEQISSQENNLDSENRGSSMDENKVSELVISSSKSTLQQLTLLGHHLLMKFE